MKQEWIDQFNKKCALFIGGKKSKDTLPLIRERLTENDYWLPKYGIKSLNQMKFHSDWNWIMEVVEVIEKLGYEIDIFSNCVEICDIPDENYIAEAVGKTKKEAVVQAINQFLIWYNNGQRT